MGSVIPAIETSCEYLPKFEQDADGRIKRSTPTGLYGRVDGAHDPSIETVSGRTRVVRVQKARADGSPGCGVEA